MVLICMERTFLWCCLSLPSSSTLAVLWKVRALNFKNSIPPICRPTAATPLTLELFAEKNKKKKRIAAVNVTNHIIYWKQDEKWNYVLTYWLAGLSVCPTCRQVPLLLENLQKQRWLEQRQCYSSTYVIDEIMHCQGIYCYYWLLFWRGQIFKFWEIFFNNVQG